MSTPNQATAVSKSLHVKERFRPVFKALHADVRHSNGGIENVASVLGRNPQVLRNQLNPDNTDSAPTLEAFLEVFEQAGSSRTANAVVDLIGHASVPVNASDAVGDLRCLRDRFTDVVGEAGKVMADGALAVADNRLTPEERELLGPELDNLISAAVALRALVRG